MRFSKFWHVQLVCCLEALANTARVMSGQLDMIDQSVYGGNDEKHDTHFSTAGLRERVGQEISAPNISDTGGLGAHGIDGQDLNNANSKQSNIFSCLNTKWLEL